MMRLSRIIRLLLLLPCALLAQPDRITAPIDARRTVVLKGNVHPMAQPRFDQGPVEPAFRVGSITLMLKKTDAQQAALEQLLQQQQDPASPNYHDWLTPEQYADRFGLSQSDLDKISTWLKSEGFTVEYVARGRDWLGFSGTAGQVRTTFHTELHRYLVDGEMHFAAAAEPSVPAALEPVVGALLGLDDFYPKAPRHPSPANTSGSGNHTLVPDDIATIYNIAKLGLDGTGQTIAIVGQSRVDSTDIQGFRTKYNLPPANLTLTLNPSSSDPGTSGSLAEADIDLEWVSAVAPNAALIYVYGTSADSAAFYAIDQNYAPVITESFGDCEATRASYRASYQTEAQKANTFGITWLASTGDTGAADCDYGGTIAKQGLAVNFPSSVPEVTAVGGTEFNEGIGGYWYTSNDTNGGSARSYIPEMVWNDTTAGQPLFASGGGASTLYPKPAWQTGAGVPNDGARDLPDLSLDASNNHDPYNVMTGGAWKLFGGTSVATPVFAGIVALISQYLVANRVQSKSGVGNINPTLYRLAASAPSAFHDITLGNNMVPCQQGTKDCGANLLLGYSAGTGYDLATGLGSVDAYNLVTQWPSTPAIATTTTVTATPTSILTSAATTLTATVSASTGSTTPTGSVAFSAGSTSLGTVNLSGSGATATASLRVNGSQLAPGNNIITASYGGSTSFGVSSGSVMVSVTVPAVATTTTVTANPTSITAGGSTALRATVTATSGSATPTGSVSFTLGGKSLGTANLSGSGGAASASLTVNASQLNTGTNTITASYGGATGFNASSASVTVSVSVPTTPSFVVPSVAPNPVFQQAPDSNGHTFLYTLRLSEIAGTPTTLTGLTIAGTDYSSDIQSWFGTANIPANGTIAASMWSQPSSLPANFVFGFSGTDASGARWTQQITVAFLGQQSYASMTLASLPATVLLIPDTTHCSSKYPYYQELLLQEQNGNEVQLTRFLSGGNDDSSAIGSWFGSWRLAPFGSLESGICWNITNPPTTLSYEVDGTDTNGHTIIATLSVTFQNPTSSPGALTVSKSSVSMSASPTQSAATTVNVNVPSGQPWTVSWFPASQQSGWLTVFPVSGTGPAAVSLVAAAPGLANGLYTTTLVFQSSNTTPQFVNVPVTFTIGASTTTSIGGVLNAASSKSAYAPGMILSVYGTNLAPSILSASTLPLPLTLAGVSATVNGIPAPLWAISPGQLNIQIPYETATGTALLAVSNNGQVATSSFTVSPSAPGLYTQNQAGSGPIAFNPSGNRGQIYTLYVNGAGEVSPPVATGAGPAGTQVPAPLLAVSVTVGGVAATLTYVGLPSWSAATLQVNFTVPPNAPLGVQSVMVTVGSASSPAAATFTVF